MSIYLHEFLFLLLLISARCIYCYSDCLCFLFVTFLHWHRAILRMRYVSNQRAAKISQKDFDAMCDALVSGISMAKFCKDTKVPCTRTYMRNIANNPDRYEKYKECRALQAELLLDAQQELVNIELPDDPKLANAKVQLTRMQFDANDKLIRQLAPYGVRNKPEDTAPKGQVSGNITISWEK